jgi:thymidylate kinase
MKTKPLLQNKSKFICITGPAGSGKTSTEAFAEAV